MKIIKDNAPKIGDTRVVTRFLVFPMTIGNDTRWLELATWIEKYEEKSVDIDNSDLVVDTWIPESWEK